MQREGHDGPLTFDLVRDEIPRDSVDIAFLLKPGIGYIHVTNFMETTSREVGDALDNFQAAGTLHGLILDLRDNPGGLLNEAVNVSDKFLKEGQIVVSQRGRAFPDQVYRAAHGEEGTDKYPIVVLVNRNTASAAEIVSGALQDHDRALIVGETTFGKGLVQTVFNISEDTGLALTTYHYYTPSGRLIQRDYDGVSLYDYFFVRDDAKKADKSNLEVKLTDSGRTVYGGGGITPDEKIDVRPTSTAFRSRCCNSYELRLLSATSPSTTWQPTPSPATSSSTTPSSSSSRTSSRPIRWTSATPTSPPTSTGSSPTSRPSSSPPSSASSRASRSAPRPTPRSPRPSPSCPKPWPSKTATNPPRKPPASPNRPHRHPGRFQHAVILSGVWRALAPNEVEGPAVVCFTPSS